MQVSIYFFFFNWILTTLYSSHAFVYLCSGDLGDCLQAYREGHMTAQAKSKTEHTGKIDELALTHNVFKAQLEGKDDSHALFYQIESRIRQRLAKVSS